MADPVSSPSHYAGAHGVEAKEAMANMANRDLSKSVVRMSPMAIFWWCAAFKYLWRFPFKNGRQDVAKCAECLRCILRELDASESGEGGRR